MRFLFWITLNLTYFLYIKYSISNPNVKNQPHRAEFGSLTFTYAIVRCSCFCANGTKKTA